MPSQVKRFIYTCDAFSSEALYEADKALQKFAAVPQECVSLQDGGRSRQ